jgi:ferredoxin
MNIRKIIQNKCQPPQNKKSAQIDLDTCVIHKKNCQQGNWGKRYNINDRKNQNYKAIEIVVEQKSACMQRATKSCAWENIDYGNGDRYPKKVTANQVW